MLYKEATVKLCSKEICLSTVSSPQLEKAFVVLKKVEEVYLNSLLSQNQKALKVTDPLDDLTSSSLSAEFFSLIPTARDKQKVDLMFYNG